jgi:hypothetical protein
LPGFQELEVDMSNPFRNTVVVAAVVLAVLVAAPSCQCDSEESRKPQQHAITVEMDERDEYRWTPIETFKMWNGDRIRIDGRGNTVWILIPENRFILLEGACDWASTESFTAFKVEKEPVTIQLDGCDTSAAPEQEIHYSVLVKSPEDEKDQWEYIHGDNPPPGMIVPGKR